MTTKYIYMNEKQMEKTVRLWFQSQGAEPNRVVIKAAAGPDQYGYCTPYLHVIYGEDR